MKKKLTKKRALELHAELWMWLALNPNKQKQNWPRWKVNGGSIPHAAGHCFCCEYDNQFASKACKKCPVIWGNRKALSCFDSQFAEWDALSRIDNKSLAKRTALAFEIAALPERK